MLRQLLPVGSHCSLEAEVHNLHTTIGRRCLLASCISFIPGYRYSHNPFCAQHLLALFGFCPHLPLLGPSVNSAFSHDFSVAMPRLRHRLRCRRGGSRCHRSPSPSSHSSSSRSPSESAPRRLHGNGQARHLAPSPRNDTFASHHFFEPRPTFAASIRNPSTAVFHYHCNSSRPLVIVTITVSFKEILEVIPTPPSSAPPISSQASPSVSLVSLPVDKYPSRLAGESRSGPLQATGTPAGEREAVDAAPQRVLDPDPNGKEGWWCRIEEESPSGDYAL